MNIIGLVLTLVLGSFILIGVYLVHLFKNKDKFLLISLSMAFGVMISLLVLEIIPEVVEIFTEKYNTLNSVLLIFLFTSIGFLILKILDRFVPEHDSNNLSHIGIVSSIAIIIHNIIEGMAIYNTVISDLNTGILLSLGVGLHNIPLGMAISSTTYKDNKKSTILVVLIALSTFIGGLLIALFNVSNEIIMGVLLSITIGMLLYINIIELLPRLVSSNNKKTVVLSVLSGVIILIISILLG